MAHIAGVIGVTNPAAATGGADAETLDDIRYSAPQSLRTLERAVTLEDYANLAIRVPGIARARATADVYTNVRLYLAPVGGSSTVPTTLRNEVLAYLEPRKLVGTSITLYNPTFVPVNITINPLHVSANFTRHVVQSAVERTISRMLSFDHVGFGTRVPVASIYGALSAVRGVDYGVVTLLARNDAAQTGTADAVMGFGEIPQLGTLTITATGGVVA